VHLLAAKGLPEITTTLTDMDVTRISTRSIGVGARRAAFLFGIGVKEEAATGGVSGAQRSSRTFGLLSLRPEESKVSTLFTFTPQTNAVNGSYLAKRFL